MNRAVFRKIMKNLRNGVHIRLLTKTTTTKKIKLNENLK